MNNSKFVWFVSARVYKKKTRPTKTGEYSEQVAFKAYKGSESCVTKMFDLFLEKTAAFSLRPRTVARNKAKAFRLTLCESITLALIPLKIRTNTHNTPFCRR